MIFPITPYAPSDSPAPAGKNLGYAYRECMQRLKDDDWALFLDHDVTFLTPHWYPLLESAVEQAPEAGIIGPTQYDPHCAHQNSPGSPARGAPLHEHAAHAQRMVEQHGDTLLDVTDAVFLPPRKLRSIMVGFAMLIRAGTWREVGLDREDLWSRRDRVLAGVFQNPSATWPNNPGVAAICGNDTFVTVTMALAGKRFYVTPGVYLYHSKMYWMDDREKQDRDYRVKREPSMARA